MDPTDSTFPDRLERAVRACDNPCVVGLDPTPESLPPAFRRGTRDLAGLAAAYERFGRTVIRACAGTAPVLKIQAACYERLGWRGMRTFERTVGAARKAGWLVIADVKRGDVPHTAAHYAEAYLGTNGADAITVNPMLGLDSLEPFLAACAGARRGLFVLVRTSNPGSTAVQGKAGDPSSLCGRLSRLVREAGMRLRGRNGWSAVGAVVGATHARELATFRAGMPRAILLLPGYGAQGARAQDVLPAFDGSGFGALVVGARRVLEPARNARDPDRALAASVRSFAEEIRGALAGRRA